MAYEFIKKKEKISTILQKFRINAYFSYLNHLLKNDLFYYPNGLVRL